MTNAEPLENPLITSNKIEQKTVYKNVVIIQNCCQVTGWPKNFSKKPSWSTSKVKKVGSRQPLKNQQFLAEARKRALGSSHTAVTAEWPLWERFQTVCFNLFFHFTQPTLDWLEILFLSTSDPTWSYYVCLAKRGWSLQNRYIWNFLFHGFGNLAVWQMCILCVCVCVCFHWMTCI